MLRTHTCGELNRAMVSQQVVLAGWVFSVRDHGSLKFIDLRDRSGVIQLVCSPGEMSPELVFRVNQLRDEWVVQVKGTVVLRPPETVNPRIPTGEIEVKISDLLILNSCQTLPFELSSPVQTGETIRLVYRFLDLRRPQLQKNLLVRSSFVHVLREFLIEEGFAEIETPMLTKSTPEGARDFIVPSRLNPGRFYALPQSPQLFKQLLMVAGYDRYFQIARCFRDEDLRADRQPEFTQVDLEMSFVDEDDVMSLTERLLHRAIKKTFNVELKIPFPRINYQQAIDHYGTDKPDLRYHLTIHDYTPVFQTSQVEVLKKALQAGGVVRGFTVAEGEKISATDIQEFDRLVKERGQTGLGWIRFRQDGLQSPLKKFLEAETLQALRPEPGSKNTLFFFLAGAREKIAAVLGELRTTVAEKLYRLDPYDWRFCWVVKFPLLEFDPEGRRWQSRHHPFTSPFPATIEALDGKPEEITSRAYDLVLNGTEIGGGSIRIHQRALQEKIFEIIGLPREKYLKQFGFLLEALDCGAPPHGGIALGLDRLMMLLLGVSSIREVMAFPKTQKGVCLMTGAPGEVDEILLRENRLRVELPQKSEQ
ncbi:MAG TPA: aspartate--tRNA ligase [bacterium]|nr:aspartate--tRNA ligase [bacterium]